MGRMTCSEYQEYETAVAEFMQREEISCLTTGHPNCPECGADFTDDDKSCDVCPNGHGHRDVFNEPYFSWKSCDCCGDSHGGNRYDAFGFNIGEGHADENVEKFSICEDCMYYAEYGHLDDTTMDELDESQN